MEGYEADSDAVGLPADEDARCTPDNPGACNAAGLPQLPASWAVRGGPRETIYFDSAEVRAAIVTVGGLCPGLNDITRGLVQSLEACGVCKGNIFGIKFGFRGFYSKQHPPITLTSEVVDSIHLAGGTMLGTSRGGSDVNRIVDAIADMQLSFVFVVGGNGGNAAVVAINEECAKRDMNVAIVGLPKSIDNDILVRVIWSADVADA
jgi:6-phosphofructokinase 1